MTAASVADIASLVIVVADADGAVHLWSPGATALAAYAPEGSTGFRVA